MRAALLLLLHTLPFVRRVSPFPLLTLLLPVSLNIDAMQVLWNAHTRGGLHMPRRGRGGQGVAAGAVPWDYKFAEIFRFCDTDGDGYLNLQELHRLMTVTSDGMRQIGDDEARALCLRS